jgi:hypothetical protein
VSGRIHLHVGSMWDFGNFTLRLGSKSGMSRLDLLYLKQCMEYFALNSRGHTLVSSSGTKVNKYYWTTPQSVACGTNNNWIYMWLSGSRGKIRALHLSTNWNSYI